MKSILIHDIKPWMLNVDMSEFDIITFDDALYSQYYYMPHFEKYLDKRIIVFVSTGIICQDGSYQKKDITCREAHQAFFDTGDTSPYMTKEQLLDLHSRGIEIGLHGVYHKHQVKGVLGMRDALNEAKISYETLLSWGITPKSMSFPYNEYNTGFKFLDRYGFEYFGDERITIESYQCSRLRKR